MTELMVVFPHGDSPHAVVIPIGDPLLEACREVAETLRETFEMPVPIQPSLEQPSEGVLGAGSAEAYLNRLRKETDDVDLAIGVTDQQLTMVDDETSHVGLFGIGYEFGPVGVVSTERLVEGTTLSDCERERLATETLSVVGTMLGLRSRVHDTGDNSQCAVAPGATRYRLNAAPTTYCDACWNALTDDTTYPKPPKPDDWVVRRRDEANTSADQDGQAWWDYPLIPIGLVFLAVVKFIALLGPVVERLPRPGTGSTRDIPQPIHTGYRIVKFWINVALYLGAIIGWSVATISLHERVFGTGFSDAGLIGLLVGSVVLGLITVWLIKGVAGGLYEVIRVAAVEEWS